MMKIKKSLAVILGAAMTMSTIPSFTSEAVAIFFENSGVPGGYEEFEDYGLLSEYADAYAYDTVNYRVFRNITNPQYIIIQDAAKQNFLQISFEKTLTDSSVVESIFNEYKDALDYDHVQIYELSGRIYIQCYDDKNEDGNYTYNPEDIADKSLFVKELTRKLYDTGHVRSANYVRYTVSGGQTIIDNTYMYIDGYTGNEEELQNFLTEYDDSYVLEIDENRDGSYKVDISATGEDIRWKLGAAIEEKFPEADATTNTYTEETGSQNNLGSVDLLTSIREEISCDTDQSGTVEITDATAILASYANTAAGVAAASAENPMDVNGDGAVGIDDATFVLTVYAELAAGMR